MNWWIIQSGKKIKSQFKNIHFDIVGRFEDDYKQTILDLSKEKKFIYDIFDFLFGDPKGIVQKAVKSTVVFNQSCGRNDNMHRGKN